MEKPDKDKLMSAVYSATMSPDNYGETLDAFDALIFDYSDHLRENHLVDCSEKITNGEYRPVLDPDLVNHIQRAHDIQLRVGRQKQDKQKILMLLDAAPNPAYLVDQGKNIIAMNNHAKVNNKSTCRNLGKCHGCTELNQCFINGDVLNAIFDFMSNGGEQNIFVAPGYIDAEKGTNTCAFVKKLENYSDYELEHDSDRIEQLYFISIVNLGFDASKTGLFRETYDLTPAEVDIAIQLASGKQPAEIAADRSAAIITIRTQIKAIKKKTNSRDIPAIVRLLCGFSAGILTSSQLSSSNIGDSGASSPLKSLEQIKLRDGRRMAYLEQGNPAGEPVIMIHNMPYGVELPKDAIEAANRMNLRIIAPYRPGTGNSDPIKNADDDRFLNQVATDINELLDRLNIPKAVIVGQSIGSVYAMRFAKLYPNQVSHLFAVSRAPIWRDEWLAGMPKRQHFSMQLTKHVPKLLPLVMQATAMFIDKGHGEKLVHSLCSESAADALTLKRNPEIVDLMVRGCEEGLKQGVEAFCRDCHLAIRDFTDEAQTLAHSFHILHGDADEIVNIRQSREFARLVPGTELEVVKGAGQLLFYSHWDRVLKAIKNRIKS